MVEKLEEETEGSSSDQIETNLPQVIRSFTFLNISKSLVRVMKSFGEALSDVVHGLKKDRKKIKRKYEEDTHKYEYIESIILEESKSGKATTKRILKIIRHLNFFRIVVRKLLEDKHDVFSDMLEEAYSETLKPHYEQLGTQFFNDLHNNIPIKSEVPKKMNLKKDVNLHKCLEYSHDAVKILVSVLRHYEQVDFDDIQI